MALDEHKLHEFLGRALVDLGGPVNAVLMSIGDELGLYKALALLRGFFPRVRSGFIGSKWPRTRRPSGRAAVARYHGRSGWILNHAPGDGNAIQHSP
jgi:hypothetical protein